MTVDNIVLPGFQNNAIIRLGIMMNSAYPMKGRIDDVRIYNRILSNNEISDLFSLNNLKKAELLSKNGSAGKNEVKIYPNPFYNELHIVNTTSIEIVDIFSATGQKLRSVRPSGNDHILIPANELPNGILILKLTEYDGSVRIEKMIKGNEL